MDEREYDTSRTSYSINDLERFRIGVGNEDEIPLDSSIVEIPISQQHCLVVLYLSRSALVDEAIQRNGWHVYPILRN